MTQLKARELICEKLGVVVDSVNSALRGGAGIEPLESCLCRLGRGGVIPHWYNTLKAHGTLPNLDGKSLGSVIEMIFVAAVECQVLKGTSLVPLRINPARGIDIPSLGLGIKSPSKNYCTSEPFFSAYERLVGNEHDAVILLTDYQTAKSTPPLRIQIISHAYLRGSQLADRNLCSTARLLRDRIFREECDVAELRKAIRFLAYINQSDIEAKAILKLLTGELTDDAIDAGIAAQQRRLDTLLRAAEEQKAAVIPLVKARIARIREITPRLRGVIDAADAWVTESYKDFGRYPNDSEWSRLVRGPLDGRIGMSYALQWRFNFSAVFPNVPAAARDAVEEDRGQLDY